MATKQEPAASSKTAKKKRQESRICTIKNLAKTRDKNRHYSTGDERNAIAKNQQIAMSRLARSKWRRDPIKERLLFLTGVGSSQIESPDYINYLEGILAEKHQERESSVIKELASLEVDREWLWRVKKDVDFTALEKASLEQERAVRAAAAAEEQDRQGAIFSAAKEMDLYTIAARTQGLDANRNVEKVIASHEQKMRENAENGEGYIRCTWLLDLNERRVDVMAPLLAAKDAREVFIAAEDVIQDIPTVEDQEEEEAEEEAERKKDANEAED